MDKITYLEYIFGGGLLMFFLKDIFIPLLKKKGTDIEDGIQEFKEFKIETNLENQKVDFRLLNLEAENKYLKAQWSESNKTLAELNKTIGLFDNNMKSWHTDQRSQNAEIKQAMDRSNILVQETTKINSELLNVLRNFKN